MPTRLRHAVAAAILFATPCAAQKPAGVMGDLMKDVSEVQGKLVGLAKAIPADKYDWRPAPGVRSVSEVFLHVSADNYLMPAMVGAMPDPMSGVNPKDLNTLSAFEQQKLPPEPTVTAINRSFAYLLKSMGDTPESKLDEKVTFFGQQMTVRQVWIATTTHLHEHLGQSIAYARMNGVTPPWSK